MSNLIEITYDKQDIRKLLKETLNHKNSELISEIIIEELCNTSKGIKNLLLAINGAKIELEDYGFKLLDLVSVDIRHILADWEIDKKLMTEKGLILNNSIEAKIVDFDRTKFNSIKIEFDAISSEGKYVKKTENIFPPNLKKEML